MPARLHHERISRSGSTPAHWLLLTHGIYGAGGNWRGIARKLTDRRTDWGVVLVDLRAHGKSDAGPSPNTIAACADDLRVLVEELGGITAIAGHSFGGKVVLATRPLVTVQQTWVLDASPGVRPDRLDDPGNSVNAVLLLLERAPKTWPNREDFVASIVADGQPLALAQWLGMNLVPDADDTYVLRLDPAVMRELLSDYYTRDLWDVTVSPAYGDVEMVIADRSDTIDAGARERLDRAPPHVHVHHIDAGHWLHIEAPGPVVELFATHLPA